MAPIYLGNGGIIRPTVHGTFIAEINLKGSRPRKTFKAHDTAAEWIGNQLAELAPGEDPLTPFQLRDARSALALLPAGVSLLDAARAWIGANVREQVTLQTAYDRFIDARSGTGRRDLTVKNYKWRLASLLASFGPELLAALTPDRLEAHLGQWSGETREDYLTTWRTFFRWCVSKSLLAGDPTVTIERHHKDARIPLHLPTRECRRLLRAAQLIAPDIVPALAVALFAGLRPFELFRIKAVSATAGFVLVDAAASKIRQRRMVAVEPALAAWLAAYPPPDGRLVPSHSTWRRRLAKIKEWVKPAAWCADILRHTFATYHVARGGDPVATSAQMGNSAGIVMSDYRGLASPSEAAKFWGIKPCDVSRFRQRKS